MADNSQSKTNSPFADFAFPLIELGRVVVTRAVLQHLEHTGADIQPFLQRHQHGDWGDVTKNDADANMMAAIHGARIISAYEVAGKRVWIITEADQSSTCVLFPSEY